MCKIIVTFSHILYSRKRHFYAQTPNLQKGKVRHYTAQELSPESEHKQLEAGSAALLEIISKYLFRFYFIDFHKYSVLQCNTKGRKHAFQYLEIK